MNTLFDVLHHILVMVKLLLKQSVISNAQQWCKYSHREATHECKPMQNKQDILAKKLGVSTFARLLGDQTKKNSKKFAKFYSRANEQDVIYYGFARQMKNISSN